LKRANARSWASNTISCVSRADSDEAAQAFRFDGAQCSDLKPPRAWSLAG
jgi:hypothetical protein